MDQPADHIEAFIARWQDVGGRERANYQLFLTELAALLELPTPEPATGDERDNAYVFERLEETPAADAGITGRAGPRAGAGRPLLGHALTSTKNARRGTPSPRSRSAKGVLAQEGSRC